MVRGSKLLQREAEGISKSNASKKYNFHPISSVIIPFKRFIFLRICERLLWYLPPISTLFLLEGVGELDGRLVDLDPPAVEEDLVRVVRVLGGVVEGEEKLHGPGGGGGGQGGRQAQLVGRGQDVSVRKFHTHLFTPNWGDRTVWFKN